MVKYILTVAGGIVIGIIIEKMIIQSKENKKLECSRLLEQCFGKAMFTSNLSMKEVQEWIKGREDRIKSGSKAIILKANKSTLSKIGKDIEVWEDNNNIVIAIVDDVTHNIEDSVLIKYEKLDQALENSLAKGDCVFVVEE